MNQVKRMLRVSHNVIFLLEEHASIRVVHKQGADVYWCLAEEQCSISLTPLGTCCRKMATDPEVTATTTALPVILDFADWMKQEMKERLLAFCKPKSKIYKCKAAWIDHGVDMCQECGHMLFGDEWPCKPCRDRRKRSRDAQHHRRSRH